MIEKCKDGKNLMATYKLTDKITIVYCTGKDSLSIVVDSTNNKEVSIHDEVISNNIIILHQCLIYNILEVCKQLSFKFNPEDHFGEVLDISRSILDVDKRVFPEGHKDEYFDKMIDTFVSMSSDEVSVNEDVEEKLANLISRCRKINARQIVYSRGFQL